MTGSTWMDVAIIAVFVAIFVWWLLSLRRSLRRTRHVVRLTLDQVKSGMEEEARFSAGGAARPQGGASGSAGPWSDPSKLQ